MIYNAATFLLGLVMLFSFPFEGNGMSAAQDIEACNSNTFHWYEQTRI